MSTLLVLAFECEIGAQKMINHVQALQRQQLITISDAAIVVRQAEGNIKVKQMNCLVGAGALGGAFWGLLIGLLFWTSWKELAVSGDVARKISDYGLDDEFIEEAGNAIKLGYSALFLMVAYMTEDKVLAKLAHPKATLLSTGLSSEDEIRLHEAFGVMEEY
jgi:uncharacterized membrane protein